MQRDQRTLFYHGSLVLYFANIVLPGLGGWIAATDPVSHHGPCSQTSLHSSSACSESAYECPAT